MNVAVKRYKSFGLVLAALLLLLVFSFSPPADACHGAMKIRFLPLEQRAAAYAKLKADLLKEAERFREIPPELYPEEFTEWTKFYDNPVFRVGPRGTWEEDSVDCFTVLYLEGLYWMWYVGTSPTYHCQIGLATSPDGVNWTRCGENPILRLGPPGSWDDDNIICQQVLFDKEERIFKMWYVGGDGTGQWGIGYATSPDGIHWAKYAGNPLFGTTEPWEGGILEGQTVLKTKEGYKMWYGGLNFEADSSSIGLATSPDGIHWTKYEENPILSPTPGTPLAWDGYAVDTPDVLYFDGLYHMWYRGWKKSHGQSWFGYATSRDGIHWEKSPDNPVFFPAKLPGEWDAWQIYRGRVILGDESKATVKGIVDKMWYTGRAYSRVAQVGLAFRVRDTEQEDTDRFIRRRFPRIDQEHLQLDVENLGNGRVQFYYFTPWLSRVTLRLYDQQGLLRATVADGLKLPGFYEAHWEGRDQKGVPLPSGLYFIEIKTEGHLITREVIL